ncbi:hypothetical protein SAMN05444349_11886 [Bacteroides faecichinchillae]|uniref:Uncharacterized protein n=2 Tax=Bacteroides faecichinchillae TaxID=871325 RepID=A0A1M5BEF8_9BACE|nr:hypothetical protein [Bacteroides faecichinchillae]SHF40795.1 hypothetical protein SAMN05444349_11886 [Bacteroides faecichinchillae]
MEIRIKVNGEYLDGIESGSLKLNIASSSPYTFGESTKSYSATFKAPRSYVNDRIFFALLNFGLIERDEQYNVELTIGGVVLEETFKAKVTYSNGYYSINLSQKFVKASEVTSTIAKFSERGIYNSNQIAMTSAAELLKNAYGLDDYAQLPAIEGTPELNSAIMHKIHLGSTNELAGKTVSFEFRNVYQADNGEVQYLSGNTIYFDSTEIPNIAERYFPDEGYSVDFTIDYDTSVMILDFRGQTPPATLQLRWIGSNKSMSTWRLVSRDADDSHCKYQPNALLGGRIEWYGSGVGYAGIYYRPSPDVDPVRLDVVPPPDLTPSEAFSLTGTISDNVGDNQVFVNEDIGVTTGKDLLDNLCKANQWTWQLKIVEGKIVLNVKPILHSTVRDLISTGVHSLGEYIQDWSDYFISLETIEDSEGLGNFGRTTFGEWIRTIRVGKGLFTNLSELFSCSLPLPLNRATYPCTWAFSGPLDPFQGAAVQTDYFRSDTYLNNCIKYYRAFRGGVDVTIKAEIPYFLFMQLFREEGAYYFRQLNAWFYIRSVSDFDVVSGTCKIKMTKLTLK